MRYTIEFHPSYIKAEMRERETGEVTRAFVEAILAALRQHKLARLLISVRASRPVFKVEPWKSSETGPPGPPHGPVAKVASGVLEVLPVCPVAVIR